MADIWSFLLQTLTASGVAVLLLVVKALFQDKLSPRWQFGVWSLLGAALLLPAGWGGRYVLVNWPLWLEAAKTALTGDYGLTRVVAPIPLPTLRAPESWLEGLFAVYVLGVLVLLARYLFSYLRLRRALRRSPPPGAERRAQLERVAETYGLGTCPAVEAQGLPTAFVCGLLRPVLALPALRETDDKVLLHELLHLRYRDVGWGLLLCLLRCLHWCNPLLWYCFDRAQNDLEALCDQRVLERLEGEERRDYGRILLSMADERYARAPGTSSMANGGRNIKDRIASIARFKRYPAGMALASVCVAVILALPVLLGTPQNLARAALLGAEEAVAFDTAMASARITRCTAAAGALDAYGKAVLEQNGIYRALCAPLADHPALAAEMDAAATGPDHWVHEHWEPGLPGYPDVQSGYFIFNLTPAGGGAYTALMVFPLQSVYGVENAYSETSNWLWVAAQTVRVLDSDDGWVVEPVEDYRLVKCGSTAREHGGELTWGDEALPPAMTYTAEAEPYSLRVEYQTIHVVDNAVETQTVTSWAFGPSTSFDTVPKPRAVFSRADESVSFQGRFTGTAEELRAIRSVRYRGAPVDAAGAYPKVDDVDDNRLDGIGGGSSNGSSSDGSFWGAAHYPGQGEEPWDGSLANGSGSYFGDDPNDEPVYPASYLVELTIDGETQTLTLLPGEGGRP